MNTLIGPYNHNYSDYQGVFIFQVSLFDEAVPFESITS